MSIDMSDPKVLGLIQFFTEVEADNMWQGRIKKIFQEKGVMAAMDAVMAKKHPGKSYEQALGMSKNEVLAIVNGLLNQRGWLK